MNRNRKKAVAASVAVGMTVIMGASPILAADTDISKEETVYVNAAADGTPEDITVSDWLKNSASAGDLSDESDLKDIKNVKGDETFEQDGSNLTWNTGDKDIYYQGTTNKDLPVSMEIKYYLDGVQVSPSDLGGKSGHLKIEVNYTNNVKNKTKVGKKTTDVYAPFVMATAMILPTDNFTNVTIDNGKVLSDGQRNIAIGVGMPGLADSLDLKSIDEDIDLDIPEGFTMEADVTDFSMSSTFTFALTDLLNSLDLDDVDGLDDLKDSMDDLTDAATKLVDGSKELSDGASTLDEKYQEFDSGIGTLSSGVSTLSSGTSTLSSGVSSYTAGADTLASGVNQYVAGSNNLTSGVKTYVDGVSTLQKGIKTLKNGLAKQFTPGINSLAAGTEKLNTKVSELAATIEEKLPTLISSLCDEKNEKSMMYFADSTEAYATGVGQLMDQLSQYIGDGSTLTNISQLKDAAKTLNTLVNGADTTGSSSGTGSSSEAGTQQIEAGLATAQAAADSVSAVSGTSAADQLNAAASAVSAAAGTGDALQGDAGTISAGLDSASSAIDILSGIDTSSMDEETAAAVNSAVQSAIGAISGGVATAQGGVSNLQAHAEQVSGLNEQAAAVQAAAGEVSSQSAQAVAVGDAAAQLQSGLSQIESGLETLNAQSTENTAAAQTMDPETEAQVKALAKGIYDGTEDLPDIDAKTVQTLVGYVKAFSTQGEGSKTSALIAGAKEAQQTLAAIPSMLTQYLGKDNAKLKELTDGVSELATGAKALQTGYNSTVLKGIDQLLSGAAKLTKNNKKLKSGATQLETSGKTLTGGASQLSANSGTLTSGASKLASGAQQLVSGTATLSSGSTQVKDGIKSLSDGAKELADGTKKFDDEGIKKLSDLVEDDLQDLMDRFDAIRSDDNAYTSFSGKSSGMDGNVKFVIETAAIDNDSDK